MPDAVDMATEIVAEHLARGLRVAAAPIPAGAPGECEECGEDMPRLVGGRCARCRDGRTRIAPRHRPIITQREEPTMPTKTIMLPAFAEDAIAAVEERAKTMQKTIGVAAAELIEAGHAALLGGGAPAADLTTIDDDAPRPAFDIAAVSDADIAAELLRRMAAAAADAGFEEQLGAAIARAEAAEGRAEATDATLAQMRALLGGAAPAAPADARG